MEVRGSSRFRSTLVERNGHGGRRSIGERSVPTCFSKIALQPATGKPRIGRGAGEHLKLGDLSAVHGETSAACIDGSVVAREQGAFDDERSTD